MIQIVWRMTLVSKRGKSSMRNHIICACWGYIVQKADITYGGKKLALNRTLFGGHPPLGSCLRRWNRFPFVTQRKLRMPIRLKKDRWCYQRERVNAELTVEEDKWCYSGAQAWLEDNGSRVVSVLCDCDTLQVWRAEWKQGTRDRTTEDEHGVFIGVQVLTCRKT